MALSLGRTVAELERDLSANELLEWMAYDRLEPFGTFRDNWHMAVLAAVTTAPHTKDGKTPPLSDFMYMDPETARQRKEAAMIAWLDARSENK